MITSQILRHLCVTMIPVTPTDRRHMLVSDIPAPPNGR
jgi:hypothetical protein